MMQLNDVEANVHDQGRGAWFDALDPLTGVKTGMRFRVAGPDSKVQAQARLALVDELAEAADIDGRVSAAARERAQMNQLACCILDWEVSLDDQPLPCTHANALRLLRAGTWLRAQIDTEAAGRYRFPITATGEA